MRFRKLDKWDAVPMSGALLYVAELIDELLFDLSLDTYKPSVMTSGALCAEAVRTVIEVEEGNIRAPNIAHVTEELVANLEKDPVAQALIPLPVSAFDSVLRNKKAAPQELKCTFELLAVQLTPSKYRRKNEELLAAEVKGEGRRSELRRLTRSYVSTLLILGFSHRHLRETALKFFYYGPNRIAGNEAIDDFLALFPAGTRKFSVIFRVNRVFENAANAVKPLNLSISPDAAAKFDLAKFPSFVRAGDSHIFAVAEEVLAFDVYGARAAAEHLIKLTATFQSLFHHKTIPSWLPGCIVVDQADDRPTNVSAQVNPMHRAMDLKEITARTSIQRFFRDFSLEHDSFSKFVRSAELHSMALESKTDENQILNLWISIESLVPSETKSDDSTSIEHVVRSLVPFLNSVYVEKLLKNAVRDLFKWNPKFIADLLRPVLARRHWEKLAKLLALQENADRARELIDGCQSFPLLHDRLIHLRDMLSSPAAVKAALDAHEKRLEWQIRRIYRTRNLIVHSGNTPGYTRALIEHAHNYLDLVLNELVRLASSPRTIQSVAQGFKFVQARYALYEKGLRAPGATFDSASIEKLLFGRP